jgi:hypothetical protein
MIQITLTRRTLALVVAAFVAVAALAAGAFVRTAQADDKFNDVGTSTFFHDEISWLVDNGIANGFGSTFKPTENIKRQQAALWFSNYNDNVAAPHVASAVEAYNAEIEIVTRIVLTDTGVGFGFSMHCPSGKRAISGGGTQVPGWVLAENAPVDEDTWQVSYRTNSGASESFSGGTVHTVCIPLPGN